MSGKAVDGLSPVATTNRPFKFEWLKQFNRTGKSVPLATRGVAMLLFEYAGLDGSGIRPAVSTLVESAGVGKTAVYDHLRRLKDSGWLDQDSTGSNYTGAANLYRLALPAADGATVSGIPETSTPPRPPTVSGIPESIADEGVPGGPSDSGMPETDSGMPETDSGIPDPNSHGNSQSRETTSPYPKSQAVQSSVRHPEDRPRLGAEPSPRSNVSGDDDKRRTDPSGGPTSTPAEAFASVGTTDDEDDNLKAERVVLALQGAQSLEDLTALRSEHAWAFDRPYVDRARAQREDELIREDPNLPDYLR